MSLDLGSFRVSGEDNTRHQALSWRMDADESLSDWNIEIKRPDDVTPQVYNVHKSFLAAGKRSSRYFERLFRSNMSETSSSTSVIELEPSAAAAFPMLLDYMYYTVESVEAATETAVALRYLANYFGMEELFESVNSFIRKDFGSATALTYLAEASVYSDEKILVSAAEECAQNFDSLPEERLLQLRPAVLYEIVSKPCFAGDSLLLSRVVAWVCETHPDTDLKMLEQLTNFVRMPAVDPTVALSLLATAMTRAPEVHTLRNRTIKAASEQWLKFASELDDKIEPPAYVNLPPELKVKVLEKSLIQAKSEVEFMEEERKELKREVKDKNRELKRRQRLITDAVDATKEELTREFEDSLQEFSHHVQSEAQQAFDEKDELIQTLQHQLAALTSPSSRATSPASSTNVVEP